VNGSEQLPCDTFLALSIYYRLVPEYWLVQVIAGTRGDRQKAVDYAVRADQCAPDRIRVLMELGVSQICKGEDAGDPGMVERGNAPLLRVEGIVPTIHTYYSDRKHASMLIAEPELACEYSRDGQQDLDEENLKK
jgi:hypothetical protein